MHFAMHTISLLRDRLEQASAQKYQWLKSPTMGDRIMINVNKYHDASQATRLPSHTYVIEVRPTRLVKTRAPSEIYISGPF